MGETEEFFCCGPVEARVGDGNTVAEAGPAGGDRLTAGLEVAFDHHPNEAGVTGSALFDDGTPDDFLFEGLLAGVGVAAIDHDDGVETSFLESGEGFLDAFGVVVGSDMTAAEDGVPPRVAGGTDDGGEAVAVDAEKTVGVHGGSHGVDGDLETAVGAVFEADGHGETTGHFAVGLGLGGSGTDGGPTDKVGSVLREDGVEKFGGRGQAKCGDVEEEFPGEWKASFDAGGAVEFRIVDETFPADGGSGFFKIDAHEDKETVGDFIADGGQAAGVVESTVGVVNGAGSNDDEKPVIAFLENGFDGFAGLVDEAIGGFRGGEGFFEGDGGDEPDDFADVDVLDGRQHRQMGEVSGWSGERTKKVWGRGLLLPVGWRPVAFRALCHSTKAFGVRAPLRSSGTSSNVSSGWT